jgi:hypothetical protein
MKLSYNNVNMSYGDYSFSRGLLLFTSPLVGGQNDKPPISEQMMSDTSTMNTGDNNSIQATVECDPSSTTCFVENDTKISQNFSVTPLPDETELRLMGIRDFLAKPLLVQNINWTTASVAGTSLYAVAMQTLLNSTTAWTRKFEGFQLIRGTFVIRLRINANPFQSGLLLLHFLPMEADQNSFSGNTTYTAMHNLNLITRIQQPHLEINCRDAAADFRIPYVTPGNFFDLKKLVYDWGAINLVVMSPLRTGATGQTNLNISVYASMEDVELAAPIVPQMSKKLGRVYSKEEEALSDKSVSSAMGKVSKVAKSFHDIPILGSIAEPVSWAARVAGGVASIFGWSKPQCESAVMPMTKQELRYGATSDGNDLAYPLALLQDNRIEITTRKSLTDEDEMSFAFLKKVPLLFGGVGRTWTTSDATNASLFSLTVNPLDIMLGGTSPGSSNSTNWAVGAPWNVLANFFNFWRGSVDVTFKFIKTEYHTGTVEITWTPVTASGNLPTTTSSIYSLREVVDIRYQSEITLNLPYMVYLDYLATYSPAGVVTQPKISGICTMRVVNALRAPENASQTIEYMVYVTAGDDFEYQVPGNQGVLKMPFTPQMNETIIRTGIAESKQYGPTTNLSKMCVGEHFTSIKQLLNRFSQVYFKTSLPSTSSQSVIIWPWLNGVQSNVTTTGVPVVPNAGGDTYGIFASWYALYRGGMRIFISPSQDTFVGYPIDMSLVTTQASAATVAGGINTRGVHAVTNYDTDNNIVGIQGITETDNTSGGAYARVPYQAKTPVSMVLRQTASDIYPTEVSQPLPRVNFFSPAGAFADYAVFRSVSDEFQFMYFIGCPPYVTSVV